MKIKLFTYPAAGLVFAFPDGRMMWRSIDNPLKPNRHMMPWPLQHQESNAARGKCTVEEVDWDGPVPDDAVKVR